MSRLTLRLPESLHETLTQQAQTEDISLNQFIVYLLTKMTTVTDLQEQRRGFEELRNRYQPAEAEAALQELLVARNAPPT